MIKPPSSLCPPYHWTDGTKFDLKAIGDKCKENSAIFIVDGTQSVGIVPIDVIECNISALICANYKWLLGPYSTAVTFLDTYFDNGIPIEDSWMNRNNAEDFANLTDYDDTYKSGASMYNVGEYSNFILLPMMNAGFKQILEWGIENIKSYCENLIQPLIDFLQENEFWIEDEDYRSSHLVGFKLPPHIDKKRLIQSFKKHKVYISLRSGAIRVSPHVYNTEEDIQLLIQILKGELNR